jgi:hypothetical protein
MPNDRRGGYHVGASRAAGASDLRKIKKLRSFRFGALMVVPQPFLVRDPGGFVPLMSLAGRE